MARLGLTLLGGFEARLSSGPAVNLPAKAQALLAYLALRPGQAHPRGKLAALLWADSAEPHARASLRQTLSTLGRALAAMTPPSLVTGDHTVVLDPAAADIDVAAFERAVAEATPETLERAATLYRGDLLEGLGVTSPPFEEWLLTERERLRELALEALARLLAHYRQRDRADEAVRTALQLLALDPLQEPVHQVLMRLYAGQGRRGAALRQYQTCVEALQRELGVEPEGKTKRLYQEIVRSPASLQTVGRESAWVSPPATGDTPGRRQEALAGSVPLIGRDTELARLCEERLSAWQGAGRLAVVLGEAGIGKSRLVAEVAGRALADGGRVLFGRAYEGEQLPFGPWVDALRSGGLVADARQGDVLGEPWRIELARLFPELGPTRFESPRSEDYVRLFEAIAILLRTAAEREPLVIIVEDLHWTDTLSIRLLVFLRRQLAGLPVFLLGTVREEEIEATHPLRRMLAGTSDEERLVKVELTGLSQEHTVALVQAVARAGSDPAALARLGEQVWRASDGNPLVIVEIMRSPEGRDLPASGALPVPRRVKEIVRARLERLGERARMVLGVAAVIGREFDFALLDAAAGRSPRETAEAVEELVGRRVLHAVGERLDFTHDRVRQVAYERVIPTTRLVLHRAVGEALERLWDGRLDEVADQLGHHYFQAVETGKAVPYLVRFAELAAQRYALNEALAALGQARAAADLVPPAERDRTQLDVALRQAFVLSLLGRQQEVRELVRAHASHLERVQDVALVSEYYFRVAITHFYLGEYTQACAAAQRALEEGECAGDAERIGKALHVLSISSYGLGRPRSGIEHARRAVSFLDRPHTQHWLGLVHHDLALSAIVAGDLDSAVDASERCRAVGISTGDVRLVAEGGYSGAWAHVLRGDLDLALGIARRAIETSRDPMASGLTSGVLGWTHLERGEVATAIPLLQQAVERLSGIPVMSAAARNMVFLAEAYLMDGDVTRAGKTAREALAISQAGTSLFNVGLAERALGRIALAQHDVAGAGDHLLRSLDAFIGCDAAVEGALAHALLAEVRAAQADPTAARDHLVTASNVFVAAGAPKRVAAIRDLARELAVEVPAI
jgi:DNA-binding SARP family transcriptional activator